MPTPHTLTVTKLSDLVITVSSDGGIAITYPGQTTITQSPTTYYKWYTYGILGSGTNPLVFVSVSCPAPSGSLKTESYVNNASLALALGTNTSSKYIIIGNGDMRPGLVYSPISVSVDNQSLNSGSSSYPNYNIVCATGSGAGATVSFYHP